MKRQFTKITAAAVLAASIALPGAVTHAGGAPEWVMNIQPCKSYDNTTIYYGLTTAAEAAIDAGSYPAFTIEHVKTFTVMNVIEDAMYNNSECKSGVEANKAADPHFSMYLTYSHDASQVNVGFRTYSSDNYNYTPDTISVAVAKDTNPETAAIAEEFYNSLNGTVVYQPYNNMQDILDAQLYDYDILNDAQVKSKLNQYSDHVSLLAYSDLYRSQAGGLFFAGYEIPVFVDGIRYFGDGGDSIVTVRYDVKETDYNLGDLSFSIINDKRENLPDGTALTVENKTTAASTVAAVRDGEELIAAYDFTLAKGDQKITNFEYDALVMVALAEELPADGDEDRLYLRYINEDGEVTQSDIPVVSFLSPWGPLFHITHLSTYALILTDDPIIVDESANPSEETPNEMPNAGVGTPDTGFSLTKDNGTPVASLIAASILALFGAGSVAAIIAGKKRRIHGIDARIRK